MLQKRIADELGVEMGSYTHRANSFHCYERDFKLLDGYCQRILSGEELTYNYAGEWDELMQAERPEIEHMVSKLKNKE
jgi:thymidylate synthase